MLKIAEYNTITGEKIDLKELEKYGFIQERFITGNWCKKVYLGNDNDDKNFYVISISDRIINLTRLDGELDDTLYDLIKDGLVEKVDQ